MPFKTYRPSRRFGPRPAPGNKRDTTAHSSSVRSNLAMNTSDSLKCISGTRRFQPQAELGSDPSYSISRILVTIFSAKPPLLL